MQWGILKSKVARKIFLLFIVASLLPLLIGSLISFRQVENIIESDSFYNLKSTSKEYGLSLFFRLKVAKDTLFNHSTILHSTDDKTQVIEGLSVYFSALGVMREEGALENIWGDLDVSLADFYDRGDRSIFTVYREENKYDVFIKLKNGVIGKLNTKYLWSIDSANSDYEFCVTDYLYVKVFCQSEITRSELNDLKEKFSQNRSRNVSTVIGDEEVVITYWELFLDHEFGIDPWKIVVSQNRELINSRAEDYRVLFIPFLIFSLITVFLVSSILIRKNLDVINIIIDGTRKIVKGDYKSKITIPSDDELSELADSFNVMSSNMATIVRDYQAFSEIDLLILESQNRDILIGIVLDKLVDIFHFDNLILINHVDNRLGLSQFYQLNDQEVDVNISLGVEGIYHLISALELTEPTVFQNDKSQLFAMFSELFSEDKCFCVIPVVAIDESQRDQLERQTVQFNTSFIIGAFPEASICQLEKDKLNVFANRISIAFLALAREEELLYKANHDNLTGLPNKHYIMTLYDEAEMKASVLSALLFLDLDHFKQVNDNYGHIVGDMLLMEFSKRLETSLSGNATVSRIGGDEFVILLQGHSQSDLKHQAEKTCETIIELASQPFHIRNHVVHVGASIGIFVGGAYPCEFSDAIRYADVAMYFSKQQKGNHFSFYDKDMSDRLLKRTLLERDLRLAIETDEIEVYYQPKYSAEPLVLVGFEALFRWHHSIYGPISPMIAIEIAESIGVIKEIGEYVFIKALKQWQRWLEAGYGVGTLAINISPSQLLKPGFCDFIKSTIARYPLITPELIVLEITESVMLKDREQSIRILQELRDYGVSVAIDDFGTGYSSLAYLLELPADTLKIDRSFVTKIEEDPKAVELLEALIRLGKSIGFKIVAEGVETATQASHLIDCDCDELQGYFYSKPLPSDKVEYSILRPSNSARFSR